MSRGRLWGANQRWIWLALCRPTRQVVACMVGGRGEATCRQLWKAVLKAYKRHLLYTVFWQAYQAVLPHEQHEAVSKDSGLTALGQRFNNTIRYHLARFVRKTLSFSKSDHIHLLCLHHVLVPYNLEVIRA